jgi:undecaprenyl-diphosphatase
MRYRCGARSAAIGCAAALLCAPLPSRAQGVDSTTANFGLREFGLSASVLAVVMLTADAPAARALHGAASPGTLTTARQFARLGDATGILPIVGGVALAGIVTGNRSLQRAAAHSAEAVALAGAMVQVGKYLMGRERPYADPDLDGLDFLHYSSSSPSFPSGHTAAAFALATSLGDAIDRPWARIGLYALATGTGWARMAAEAHWLSDVLAGAVIGTVSAKFVAGRLTIFGVRAPRMIVGPTQLGVSIPF